MAWLRRAHYDRVVEITGTQPTFNSIGIAMKKTFKNTAAIFTGTFACLVASSLVHSATMTRTDMKIAKDQLSSDYQKARVSCGTASGNARDICMQEAMGAYKVGKAELTNRDEPSPRHLRAVAVAKADSVYEVAKEKCDDSVSNARTICRTEAKAKHDGALADAKLTKTVTDAITEDVEVKRNSDYKVAAEKCDALTGDTKASCMDSAKARFNKI